MYECADSIKNIIKPCVSTRGTGESVRFFIMRLFLTAFLQVFLVSANTLFISRLFYPGIIIAGFGISWFWSGNVRKVAIGNNRDRLIYSLGACIGGLSGVLTANLIKSWSTQSF